MTRFAACLALVALAGAGQAYAQAPDRDGPPPPGGARLIGYGNPSAAIAAELAFARLALEKGQWTAFAATAAPDAVMFAPNMVLAQTWLKNRANPVPPPLTWRPHQAWSSCDGSLMVTTGAWRRGETHGWFTTVWQRQEKGGLKWMLDHGDATAEPVTEPDFISARVAECPPRRVGDRPATPPPGKRRKPPKPEKPPPVPFDPARREGRSRDGSLVWTVTVAPDGARRFTARMMQDGRLQDIRDETVGAPWIMMELFVSAFVTLFVVIDPPGCAPIFAGLTSSAPPADARRMAFRACTIAASILLVFALFGEKLLGALHIELNSFRIAGGIMLFLIAIGMVFEKRTERREKRAEEVHDAAEVDDVSVFPLAIPMIAGPGSIATIMLLMARAQGTEATLVILAAMGAVMLLCLAALLAAGPIMRLVGAKAEAVVTRLLGVLLGALAAQYVIDGLRAVFAG